MPRELDSADADLPLELTRQIDALCDEFESALKLGAGASLENYAGRIDPRWRIRLLEELTLLALERLQEAGLSNPRQVILDANISIREELERVMTDSDGAATVDMVS